MPCHAMPLLPNSVLVIDIFLNLYKYTIEETSGGYNLLFILVIST